jgi:hypothetical protein
MQGGGSSNNGNGLLSALLPPDGDVAILDATRGIVRTRAGGVEFTVCKNTRFPEPRVTPGRLQWVPSERSRDDDRGETHLDSNLVLTGSGRSMSGGSSQRFVCFGSRGLGYFLQHISMHAPSSSSSNSTSSGDSSSDSIIAISSAPKGASVMMMQTESSTEEEGRSQEELVFARSTTATYVRIMQELVVESELNCLAAGEASAADLLFDADHLRLTEVSSASDVLLDS